jgi:hypothetical protein
MSNKDNRRQLATAWMRDRLIEEFRKRPEHSTHDVMVEVIIDQIYERACQSEETNIRYGKAYDLRPKLDYDGAKVERRKFTVDNLKDKEIK